MTDRDRWEIKTQYYFLSTLVNYGLDSAAEKLSLIVDSYPRSVKGYWKRCQAKSMLKKVENIRDDGNKPTKNGRFQNEQWALNVLDKTGKIANGVSIVGHVPDFQAWLADKHEQGFPKVVIGAIKPVANQWAVEFLDSKGGASLDDLIKDMANAAEKAVAPIVAKGYMALRVHEENIDIPHITNEIETLYQNSGAASSTRPSGTPLWHTGAIDHTLKITFARPLWTTDSVSKNNRYVRQAIQNGPPAFRLHLSLISPVFLAHFNGINLLPLMPKIQNDHAILAYCLKEWAVHDITRTFSGLLGTNGGTDEVVLFAPETLAEVVQIDDINSGISHPFTPPKRFTV